MAPDTRPNASDAATEAAGAEPSAPSALPGPPTAALAPVQDRHEVPGTRSLGDQDPSTPHSNLPPTPLQQNPSTPSAVDALPPGGAESEKIEAIPPHPQPSASYMSAEDIEKAKPRPEGGEARTETPDPLELQVPPSLNYTLRTRKAAIAIFWTLILIDSIAIPLVLYFCLHYLTSLSPNAVFSISTACLGGISIVEYFLRFWRLWRHRSTCRVIGARRWYLDWFHWNFSAAWIFIMAELIVGTSPDNPPIRLLAMPLSSLCFWFSLSLLTQDALRLMDVPAPIRISSVPKGEPLRPGVYSIIEDICAVDGSGGTEFRQRLNARYEASHYFRQMLHRLTLVWAIGMLSIAIATTVLVFTLSNHEIAYIIGWTVPFVWAGLLTLWTFYYVKRCLKREYAKWAEQKVVP